jgi:hypothetical protein
MLEGRRIIRSLSWLGDSQNIFAGTVILTLAIHDAIATISCLVRWSVLGE